MAFFGARRKAPKPDDEGTESTSLAAEAKAEAAEEKPIDHLVVLAKAAHDAETAKLEQLRAERVKLEEEAAEAVSRFEADPTMENAGARMVADQRVKNAAAPIEAQEEQVKKALIEVRTAEWSMFAALAGEHYGEKVGRPLYERQQELIRQIVEVAHQQKKLASEVRQNANLSHEAWTHMMELVGTPVEHISSYRDVGALDWFNRWKWLPSELSDALKKGVE